MGRMADRAGIQFKMLNRGRGPAVWSPRAQEDKALYRSIVREHLESTPEITILAAQVVSFVVRDGAIHGVQTADGAIIEASAVVVTPGTFLNGLLHVGDKSSRAARRRGAVARPLRLPHDLGFTLVR